MNRTIQKIKRVIGIAVLTVFVFSFLHSELGFLNHDDDNHSSHDHCTIVNGRTTPPSKTHTSELTKLTIQFVFIPKLVEVENQRALRFFLETDTHHFTNKTNKVKLDNNTFLI